MILTEKDLYSGIGFIPDIENLDEVLSWQPKKELIVESENIPNYKYIPIQHKEFLMDRLFGHYSITIKQSYETKTGCTVIVNVQAKNISHDGISSIDFAKNIPPIMAYPLAKTLAISDALDHFGIIFGRNINRRDVTPKKLIEENKAENEYLDEIKEKFSNCMDIDTLNNCYKDIQQEMVKKKIDSKPFEEKVKSLYTKRKYSL